MKGKVLINKIQVYLIRKFIDIGEKTAQYFETKVGKSSTVNKK